MENFGLYLMEKKDATSVAELWHKLARNQLNRDEYYVNSRSNQEFLTRDSIAYFENSFDSPDCFVFVAKSNNKIIGFSEMWFRKKDFFFNIEDYAYILHLFVDTSIKTDINPLLIPYELCHACEKKAIEYGYHYIGGDVFEFNRQMKLLLKFFECKPYRTRYMKFLNNDNVGGTKHV